ncbi:hypothetical protein ADK60_26505 [Streptomyces sp. XY431]|nr:hypothetical protein ADK60_26505 [Streptomyces sp. XY431]
MRLDHLLSKEQYAACRRMSCTVAHGWNVDYSAHLVGIRQYCFGVEDGLLIECVGHVVGS